MNRFFAESLEEAEVALTAFEAHHAVDVLRLGAGEQVELFDGAGRTAVGRIVRAGRGKAAVRIEQLRPTIRRGGPLVHLAFAVPKGKRLDWLLEKATELGAASLRPVRFERSVAGGEPGAAKRGRWLAHCIAAAKQSGLNFLPEIRRPLSLEEFLKESAIESPQPGNTGGDIARLLGDVSPEAPGITNALEALRPPLRSTIDNRQSEIVLLVGPEGGLTDAERAACLGAGFAPVRIGRTTLRTETAAIALLAAATAILG